MFSQAVIEQLEHYVYFLKDPRKKEIFYVGKGVGNRVFNHLACALETPSESDKLDRIREITESGAAVQHYILRHGLKKEEIAFEVEAAAIDLLGLSNLTNIRTGHNSGNYGIQTAEQISAMYEAEDFCPDGTPLILININRLYKRTMSEADLYFATRKSWKVGPRRERARYAIPTFRGLTREVYRIDRWLPSPSDGPGRWLFEGQKGEEAIRERFRYKSIVDFFPPGAANPIKYIDC